MLVSIKLKTPILVVFTVIAVNIFYDNNVIAIVSY